MKTFLLISLLLLSACGKEGQSFPDTSGQYACTPGATGSSTGLTTIVVSSSDCVRVR